MTDAVVQDFFIETFEGLGKPLLTSIQKDGKTEYTNISYPNRPFSKPENNYWFELFFLSTMPFQQELGQTGRNRWQGIFQVNICVPKDVGTKALNARFEKIAETFKRGYIADGIRILSVGRTAPHSFDDYYSQPINISYEADLDN